MGLRRLITFDDDLRYSLLPDYFNLNNHKYPEREGMSCNVQYHDVRVTIDFRPASQCVNVPTNGSVPAIAMDEAQLVIDYVYLDSEERKRFAQASHEYLFEQLQFTGSESVAGITNKYRLNFNHPSKFLVWAPHLEKYATANDYISYTTGSDWEAARERYAKVMWLATRKNLSSGPNFTINAENNGNNGEVWTPSAADWVDVSGIDAKVTAQAIFQADISGNPASMEANIENVVLLTNNFTMEDLSLTTADALSAFGTPSNNATAFVDAHSYTVVDHFNYGNNLDRSDNPVVAAKLQLNGSDRFQERDGHYFNYVQPWQHFSNTPADGINVYSFALKPEDHQPSGTCNFSRIDNATLNLRLGAKNHDGDSSYLASTVGGANSNSLLNIYTVNYNVLRVMSGMAGAAYSN
jgi:hypothetical protein